MCVCIYTCGRLSRFSLNIGTNNMQSDILINYEGLSTKMEPVPFLFSVFPPKLNWFRLLKLDPKYGMLSMT